MGRKSQYSDKQKETFAEIAMIARGAGRTWEQTFEAVKKAGFKSSLPYLMKIVEGPSIREVNKEFKKFESKRGRPKGSKNKVKSDSNGSAIKEVDAIIKREIEARVTVALKLKTSMLKSA